MEIGAERGHTGEEAWTIMTLDGEEVLSSAAHILGLFVGYIGYNSHKRTTNDKRNNYADFDLDIKNLLPCFIKAQCDLRAAGVYILLSLQTRRGHLVQ
jgi:hypothetical protein